MSRSGKQSDLAKRRGDAGAKASAASPKRKWPLRAVVGQTRVESHPETLPGVTFHREVLECGHTIGQARDMIGDRYPARRRCGKCYRGAAPDTEQVEPQERAAILKAATAQVQGSASRGHQEDHDQGPMG